MLRVANLCAELTSRNHVFLPLWHQAAKSLHHRNMDSSRDRISFNDYFTKIPVAHFCLVLIFKITIFYFLSISIYIFFYQIQTQKCRENFKTFLSILASRHCIVLNELIILVVRICVMACPGSKQLVLFFCCCISNLLLVCMKIVKP